MEDAETPDRDEALYTLRPFAYADFELIAGEARKTVLQALSRLKKSPLTEGKALVPVNEWQRFPAPLVGCWRMIFDVGEAYFDTYCVVYRIFPEEREIEILAIRPHKGSEAFRVAAERLSPPIRRRPTRPNGVSSQNGRKRLLGS